MTKPNFLRKPQTQQEIVDQIKDQEEEFVWEELRLPGIATLHEQPKADIGQVFANLLKSRTGVEEMHWIKGDCIRLKLKRN